jgi:hypothetical protein
VSEHSPSPTPEIPGQLADLLKVLPGGKWIAPHALAGPFWLVPIEAAPAPNWQAEAVLGSFASVLVPYREDYSEEVRQVAVYAVPDFCWDLLQWHSSDEEMRASDLVGGPYETMPGPDEMVACLPMWLDFEDDDEAQDHLRSALDKASAAQGPTATLELIRNLPTDVLGDLDVLADTLLGVLQAGR